MKFDTTETNSLVYKIIKFINFLASKLSLLNNKIESINNKIPEIIVSIAYIVLHILVSLIHEPWYDEAVAWQIAKSASVKDILFNIPHYECHPSLWHLILKPFAASGVSYETGLMLATLIFAGGAVLLLLWKAKLPRLIKLLIPFTYFVFYQYGVISRPYCVMMLAFVVLALNYNKRNEKPWLYILSLIFLCLTSAYGIVIAGGLAICFVIEIIKSSKNFKEFITDKRVISLFVLLLFALFLLYQIIPASDTYATKLESRTEYTNSVFKRGIYLLFAVVPDSVITYVFNYALWLSTTSMNTYSLITGSIVGLVIWIIAYFKSRSKKTFLTLLVPYLLLTVFSITVYFSIHHVGIYLLFFLFWCYITHEKEPVCEDKIKPSTTQIINSCIILFTTASLIVSIYWSVAASLLDKKYDFAIGRAEAEFIKKYNLTDYNILGEYEYDEESGYLDTNHVYNADNICAYFDKNIFFNHNNGEDSVAYSTHRIASEEENAENLKLWSQTIPDVIFGDANLEEIYGDTIDYSDYTLVFIGEQEYIYKTFTTHTNTYIYVRNELAEELGIEKVNIMDYKLY